MVGSVTCRRRHRGLVLLSILRKTVVHGSYVVFTPRQTLTKSLVLISMIDSALFLGSLQTSSAKATTGYISTLDRQLNCLLTTSATMIDRWRFPTEIAIPSLQMNVLRYLKNKTRRSHLPDFTYQI